MLISGSPIFAKDTRLASEVVGWFDSFCYLGQVGGSWKNCKTNQPTRMVIFMDA